MFSGFKIVLKDGNYIFADNYKYKDGQVQFIAGGKTYYLPEFWVDKKTSERIKTLDKEKIVIFRNISSSKNNTQNKNEETHSNSKNKIDILPKIRVEGQKEPDPFFREYDNVQKKEKFIDKVTKDGFLIKIDLPLKE